MRLSPVVSEKCTKLGGGTLRSLSSERDELASSPVDTARGEGIAALDPVPPMLLVLTGVTSIQFGAAIARTMFDDLGPAGTSLLRLAIAAAVLLLVWRPRLGAHAAANVRLAALLGLVLEQCPE